MSFFDIGLEEIFVILIIALIVVGPKQLPELARKLGKSVRTMKQVIENLKTEVTQELDAEDTEKEQSLLHDNQTQNTTKQASPNDDNDNR